MATAPGTDLLTATRITVVFLMLCSVNFVNILVTKKWLLRQNREKFDCCTSPSMRTADRLQANFLEWSPIFLGLLWSLAATDKDAEGSRRQLTTNQTLLLQTC